MHHVGLTTYDFVMTEHPTTDRAGGEVRCTWCRRLVVRTPGPGRPRKFCSQPCRQWDWVSRQRAADLALGIDEIVVSRAALDALHDDLYVLAAAIDDTEQDLADPSLANDRRELRRALDWLLQSAAPLKDRNVVAVPPTD